MGIWETFSKRQKRLEQAGLQDVYQYDVLPEAFRVQVILIWRSAIGKFSALGNYSSGSPTNKHWAFIHDTLARELGRFILSDRPADPSEMCQQYLLSANTNGALDIIELSFRVIDHDVRKLHPLALQAAQITQTADKAIEELNHRFREHGIGYQYVEGKIVRVDSEFVHADIVKPALSLLHEEGFDGPAEEFINAFDHYRHDRYKEAVAEASKSFESTMKAICKARSWKVAANATAIPLIDALLKNGLIPPQLESHFSGLRSAMESGLPTLGNSTSRHGQGPDPVSIPPHFASYALHLCASNIVFLVQAHKSAP